MFCSIKKGKNRFRVYICDRKRINGKVISKDINIGSYGYQSLYMRSEGKEISEIFKNILKDDLSYHGFDEEKYLDIVVDKLKILKEKYNTTYVKESTQIEEKLRIEREKKNEKRLNEYSHFKSKYKDLYNKDLSQKYREGYDRGRIDSIDFSNIYCSDEKLDINTEEKKLLKEAIKLLSHKHHPDKGGNHETMSMINNLKDKLSI